MADSFAAATVRRTFDATKVGLDFVATKATVRFSVICRANNFAAVKVKLSAQKRACRAKVHIWHNIRALCRNFVQKKVYDRYPAASATDTRPVT